MNVNRENSMTSNKFEHVSIKNADFKALLATWKFYSIQVKR
jgi:hypothetical protein